MKGCRRINNYTLAQHLQQPPWLSHATSVPALPFLASYFPITKQEKERQMFHSLDVTPCTFLRLSPHQFLAKDAG